MNRIAGRYEITAKLGEGGMGVVYRAHDPAPMDREVAVKTLHEFSDPLALELFYKECSALKSISHPNIVEIFDMGEYEDDGHRRPFFVMPLLPGQTLDELIRKSSHRLTVDRVVEILAQTCRGLQAAHERGLIHRDLKPSNIFVMADDSVKIIDFGVAHAVHAQSRTSGFDKGTLLYMAPEQVQHKPVSVQSDVYSLGVVAYEALTRRQPFRGATEDAVIQAILTHVPPPASELNPAVSQLISRVVHKAMAKQPWNRFDTARELGDTLQKAARNEPIALFDPARIQPRIQTASRALEKGDFQFAGDIVTELEAEGNIDPEITLLRTQIDQIARRKMIAQLLESARARFEEREDPLALQKLQEVLQLDQGNVAALALKAKIEERRSELQLEQWMQLARQHVENHSYGHAREALQNALVLRPKDTRAARLLKEIEGSEREYMRLRQEKTELYQVAINAWKNGEVSQALSQMKRVLDLDREAPDSSVSEGSGVYQSFYNKIRSEYEALNNGYAQARRHLADKAFMPALQVCDDFLERYPGNALFQALRFDVQERQRQQLSAFIAETDRRVEAEQDLDARVNLLREASAQYPQEDHFSRLLKLSEDKRDLVNSIVERARIHEERGQFNEALSDIETLQTIYAVYPGLKFEKERLQKRLEQHTRDLIRGRWAAQVDQQLEAGAYADAVELVDRALGEFPDDAELLELRKVAQQGIERGERAEQLARQGQDLCAEGEFDRGVELLEDALQVDDHPTLRLTLRDLFVSRADAAVDKDWRTVEAFADRALELDPAHTLARSLRARASDHKRQETVEQHASHARRLQATGDLDAAIAEVTTGLTAYPSDPRLTGIRDALTRDSRTRVRSSDVEPAPAAPVAVEADVNAPPAPASYERTRLVNRHPVKADVVEPPRAAEAPSPTAPHKPPLFMRKPVWAGVAATAVVAVLAIMLMRPAGTSSPAAEPPIVTVAAENTAGTPVVETPAADAAVPGAGIPIAAMLRIDSAPGAVIRLGGKVLGTGPVRVELGEGSHVVEASLSGVTARVTIAVRGVADREGYAQVRIAGAKDGGSQNAEVARGEEVAVMLAVTPAQAGLTLQQLPPGTRVMLDEAAIGTVGDDGRFVYTTVSPGRHTLQIANPEYEPLTMTREFAAADTVTISGAELGLKRAPIAVEFLADSATEVRLLQQGQVVRQFTGPAKVPLAEGAYDVRAEGPAGIPLTRTIAVSARGSRPVDLRGVPSSVEGFTGSGWTRKEGWFMRRGGGIQLYDRTAPSSTITFTVRRNRGRFFSSGERLRWLVGYVDPRNHLRFELDNDRLYRTEVIGGQPRTTEVRHRIPDTDQVHLSVQVLGNNVVHRFSVPQQPNQWHMLDTLARSTPTEGQFGFDLRGNDELQMSNFVFKPESGR